MKDKNEVFIKLEVLILFDTRFFLYAQWTKRSFECYRLRLNQNHREVFLHPKSTSVNQLEHYWHAYDYFLQYFQHQQQNNPYVIHLSLLLSTRKGKNSIVQTSNDTYLKIMIMTTEIRCCSILMEEWTKTINKTFSWTMFCHWKDGEMTTN